MKTKRNVVPLIATIITFGSLSGGATAQTITNGSMTGTPGGSTAIDQNQPNGWDIPNRVYNVQTQTTTDPGGTYFYKDSWNNTPDVWQASDANSTPWGSSWVGGSPVASPDGGTFVTLLGSDEPSSGTDQVNGRYGEAIYQTLTGFTVGQEYEVLAYYAVAPWGNQYNDNTDLVSELKLEIYDPLQAPTPATGTDPLPLSEISFGQTTASPFTWELGSVRFTAQQQDLVLLFRNSRDAGAGEGSSLLVDGISLNAVPEPSSAVLFGLGGLSFFLRRRR